jgi:TetR/AcrR family transcriptional regulator, transcriptional repressor for nem operon
MARPKEFDRDTVLKRAVAVFADHGYEGTSTDALLRAMGISRQSLYDTFGDKRRLYLDALRHYITESVADQIRILNSTASPLKGVEAVLHDLAERASAEGTSGCLGVGAIWEFGRSDPEITALSEAVGGTLSSALQRRIAEGKSAGEIGAEIDVRAAAQFIQATLAGLRFAARGGASMATLRDICRMALRSLN